MENADAVAHDLQQLRDLGVRISIDDFGTGYSSLTYVKRFPVDRLKIDQCFIRNLVNDPNDAVIIRTIVSLGHSLELDVVAEGVETREQMQLLRFEGCFEMQGYYFAKPMPAERVRRIRPGRAAARPHGVSEAATSNAADRSAAALRRHPLSLPLVSPSRPGCAAGPISNTR